jgi:hypothetical protein
MTTFDMDFNFSDMVPEIYSSSLLHSIEASHDFHQPDFNQFQPSHYAMTHAAGPIPMSSSSQPSVLQFPAADHLPGVSMANMSGESISANSFAFMELGDQLMPFGNDLEADMLHSRAAMNFSNAGCSQRTMNTAMPAANENAGELAISNTGMGAIRELNGPTSGQYKVLPAKRRGGRKGRMTQEELAQRKNATSLGICFRCRKMKIKV